MHSKLLTFMAVALATSLAACDGTQSSGEEFDFFENGHAGKADLADKAHVLDDIDLRSTISGTFRREVRVYGYTFEAKAGAVVSGHVSAVGGEDSFTSAGEKLDMIMGLYGPMVGDAPGERMAYVDQSDSADARLPGVEIPEDGRYMLVFSTWDDPGKGTYTAGVDCAGTDFQCRRPIVDAPCEDGTLYIEGDTPLEGDLTWKTCNIVLLEPTTIPEGVNLTIQPGVTVQGNFLDLGAGLPFGDVALIVEGRLQAVGTEEHPVVFTAFKDGWKGLELKGTSNHLEHVYVESARTGITYAEGSTNNSAVHLNVNGSLDAIRIEKAASVNIEDVVLTGTSEAGEDGAISWQGSGIIGRAADPSTFVRSMVTGYARGIDLAGSEFEFLDSTFAKNDMGIEITGDPLDLHEYPFTCPPPPQATSGVSRTTPTPTRWGRDPAFRNCDIIGNESYGLRIRSPELLIIEGTNVRDNGKGIEIHSTALHPESRINQSNIYGNGEGPQVDAWHVVGTLDISDNFWNAISDPELSASWQVSHSIPHTCTHRSNSTGRPSGNGWTCSGSRRAWNCRATVQASWEGEVNFSGFSPTELEAGPRVLDLADHVQQARQKAGL